MRLKVVVRPAIPFYKLSRTAYLLIALDGAIYDRCECGLSRLSGLHPSMIQEALKLIGLLMLEICGVKRYNKEATCGNNKRKKLLSHYQRLFRLGRFCDFDLLPFRWYIFRYMHIIIPVCSFFQNMKKSIDSPSALYLNVPTLSFELNNLY